MDLQTLISTILFSFIFLLIMVHFYIHGSRRGRLCDKIPGPKWYPIIGNALDVMVPLEDLWNFFRRSSRNYYPVFKLWLGFWPIINIRHADDVEILLSSNKNIKKSLFYDYLHPWLHDGLLTSTGNKWRSRRKILTPAFHLHNLHEYMGSITDHTDRMITKIKSEIKSDDGVIKELLPLLTTFTLSTICESAMGATAIENDPAQKTYKQSVYEIGEIFYYRAVRPWLKSDWIFNLTAKGREQAKSLKILHGFSDKIIKEREKYHEETNGKYLNDFISDGINSSLQTEEKVKRKRLAFLDLLIAASKRGLGVDDRGIREEVDTFVFEGHDTTAMGMFFAILLLAEHKDIQARAREEIDAVLKESNGKISVDEVQKFTYLECCIKESLRLYPSVPIIAREIQEDLQLKNCFVPKGALVNIHIVDTHRDPNFWPRPNIFDPDRFSSDRIEKRHPFSYIPFSGGPRNCIGQKFAMLELKTLIAGLLHNFYLEPQEIAANISILPDLVIRAAHPVFVKFVPIVLKRSPRIVFYLEKIPGPKTIPIIGNALDFLVTPDQLWDTVRSMNDNYYPIYRVWSLKNGVINIRHPDDIEVLLSSSKNISKSMIYFFLYPWFGTGLLTSTGSKWQKRRKILTPAFHFNVLREFSGIFDQEARRMVKDLQFHGQIALDLVPFITKYTLNAICETAMGTSLEGQKSSMDNFQKIYRKAIHDLGNLMLHRLLRPWLHPNFSFHLSPSSRLQSKCLDIVRGFSKKIIGERKKYHEDTQGIHLKELNETNVTEVDKEYTRKKRLAMLDLLIAAMRNGHIDEDGIWEEVDTFMFEGHDTTAMGICFTLLLLAEHNEIQERVRQEFDDVIKSNDGQIGITELQKLSYLERCIKEALRLYPSVPFISRNITDDMQLKKYFIPKDTMAHIHIYDLHRDPNFWPDPLRYDPDRFLPENIQGRHPFSYVPFSAGPRNCIGQKFAMLELKAIIGHLIHNFYLEPIDLAGEIRMLPDLVLRPKNSARIKLTPRQ
ncbi:uncharacterized protein LOC103573114 [Microplitis demolitor]|nr:uncharacterized protein LOC103573114 [Microplitis demolitor]